MRKDHIIILNIIKPGNVRGVYKVRVRRFSIHFFGGHIPLPIWPPKKMNRKLRTKKEQLIFVRHHSMAIQWLIGVYKGALK
jgi:hypothetical protein